MTDRPLLQQYAAAADATAFAELVRRHGPLVHAAARRLAGDDADDVAQAAFILLSQKAKSLAGRENVAGWLYETTRLCARNARRSRGRRIKHLNQLQETTMHTGSSVSSVAAKAEPEWTAVLDDAMATLPKAERGVVLLRYMEGRSLAEAAEQLAITPAAVAKRAERAIARMRAFFQSRGYAVTAEQAIGGLAVTVSLEAAQHGMLLNAASGTPTAAAKATAALAAKSMLLTQLKLVGVVTIATAIVGTGVAVPVLHQSASASPVVPAGIPNAAPAPLAVPAVSPSVVASAAMTQTYDQLQKMAPEIRMDSVSLKDALSFLSDTTSITFDVDWKSVAAAGVDPNTPVSIRLRNVRMDKVILVVLQGAGGDLLHTIREDGRVYVGRRQDVLNKFGSEQAYPAADLISSTFSERQRLQLRDQIPEWALVINVNDLSREPDAATKPWRWEGETFFVTTTPEAHWLISQRMAELRQDAKPAKPSAQPATKAAGG